MAFTLLLMSQEPKCNWMIAMQKIQLRQNDGVCFFLKKYYFRFWWRNRFDQQIQMLYGKFFGWFSRSFYTESYKHCQIDNIISKLIMSCMSTWLVSLLIRTPKRTILFWIALIPSRLQAKMTIWTCAVNHHCCQESIA